MLATGLCAACAAGSTTNRSPLADTPVSATASATPALTEPDWANCEAGFIMDLLHQDVDLQLDLNPPRLLGHGSVRVRARTLGSVLSLDAHGLSVSAVTLGKHALEFRHLDQSICIALPRSLAQGAELELGLSWQVTPERGEMPRFSSDHVWAGYQTSAWMPTLQDPAQRATLRLRVNADAAFQVTASGQQMGTPLLEGGRRTWTFAVDRPTPPFLFAFAAGHFEEAELVVDGTRFRAFGPSGEDLRSVLDVTAQIYKILVARTGLPLAAKEYLQVFVSEEGAAQEAAGIAFLSASSIQELKNDPTEDWIFTHELAHQWFGWLVPCADFRDFWLNEGFASFMIAVVKEQRWGQAAYDREVELWRTRSATVHAEGKDAPISLSNPKSPAPGQRFADSELQPRGVTYARGALVLAKLRGELGDAAFWTGVHRYLVDRAGKGARSEDLRRAFEAVSGRDLTSFFADWVYAPAPTL